MMVTIIFNFLLHGEACYSSASQEISCMLWRPKVHCYIYNSPPPDPILSQTNPVHSPTPFPEDPSYYYYTSIYVRVFQVVSFPQVSQQICMNFSSPPYALHSRPSHSSRFVHQSRIWKEVQIIKPLIMYFSPLPCYLVPLRLKYSLQHPILKHTQSTFLPQCERPSFTPIKKQQEKFI